MSPVRAGLSPVVSRERNRKAREMIGTMHNGPEGPAMLLAADYHRNGVSGDGFYVGVFAEGEASRKLVIWFPEFADADNEHLEAHQSRVAVLDLDAAAVGNVYMFPTDGHGGGNAWRGDLYGEFARALQGAVEARHDARLGDAS